MNLYDLNDLYQVKASNVEQVIAEVKGFYSSGTTYNERWVFNYVNPKQIVGQLFKDSELTSNFEYFFDDSGKLTQTITSSRLPLVGWQSSVTQYKFEKDKLVEVRHLSKILQLLDYVRYEYDNNNHPVKLTFFDNLNQIISFETAEYDTYRKKYTYRIFDSDKKLISEDMEYFNLNKSKDLFNNNGDLILIQWPRSNPDKKVFHSFDYKYDIKGNWIKRKWLILEQKKKKRRSIVKRKIIYSRSN